MKPLSKSIKTLLETATAAYAEQLHVDLGIRGEHLLNRGLLPEQIKDFRLGYVKEPISGHEQYRGCLAIPGLGPSGVYSLRFRSLGGDGPKYLGLPGAQTRLFNTRAIVSAGDTICITEGEIDSITLTQCGFHSVGVTGADSWKKHHPRLFAGFQSVLVFGDGDAAGSKFAKTVTTSLTNATQIQLPSNSDVNSLYCKEGKDGILALTEEQ